MRARDVLLHHYTSIERLAKSPTRNGARVALGSTYKGEATASGHTIQRQFAARGDGEEWAVPGDCTDGGEAVGQIKESHKRGADRGKWSQCTTHPTAEGRLPCPGEWGRQYSDGTEQRRRDNHEATPADGGTSP